LSSDLKRGFALTEDALLQDTYRRRQIQRTITRQMSFDLTKLLVTEDWFSDISPQTMRRLLNIVSVTGDFCSYYLWWLISFILFHLYFSQYWDGTLALYHWTTAQS
jgi:hypothetical protein